MAPHPNVAAAAPLVAALALASAASAALPRRDLYRDLPYRMGPAHILTRPAAGADPDFGSPPPRETHRRVRFRIDGDRVVCRIHQVFFNASAQAQDVLLLAPDPGPGGKQDLEVHSRWVAQPLPTLALTPPAAEALIQEWTVLGGSPGPLARYPVPVVAHGPFRVAPRVYLKMDWRYEVRLGGGPGGLRLLTLAPGGRPDKPLVTSALEVDLAAEFRNHAFSPTHRMIQRAGGPGRWVYAPAEGKVGAVEPFLLLWPARAGGPGVGRGVAPDGTPHGMALLPPPPPPPADAVRRCHVIAIDTGGSLRGERYEATLGRVAEILRALRPEDLFEVVPFALDPHPMHRSPVAATPEAIEAALEFLRRRRPWGAVNFEAALLTALEIASQGPADASRAVVLLTDGRPTIGELRAETILAQHDGDPIPVFPVASGPDADYYFLQQLSRLSGGNAVLDGKDDTLVDHLLERLRPRRAQALPDVRVGDTAVPVTGDVPHGSPRLLAFPIPDGARTLAIDATRLDLADAPDLGPLPFLVEERRLLGQAIWSALRGEGRFPGGASSFKLLALIPGTPRPTILNTLQDGVGPLGRARVLALSGLLDQGTFEPVEPAQNQAWSGNRFFLKDFHGNWTESGLERRGEPEHVPYGSARHMEITSDPALAPHLSLGRSVGLFLTAERTARIRPPETP